MGSKSQNIFRVLGYSVNVGGTFTVKNLTRK